MLYEMPLNSGEAAFVQSSAHTTRSLSFLALVMPSSIVIQVVSTSQYYADIQKDDHVADGDG